MSGVRLIAGLGNPGQRYAHTRHNAGADFVSALAESCGASLREERRFSGLTGRGRIGGQDVHLLIPTTYYNNSGDAVAPMLRYYKLELDALLVAHDELDLPPGVARLKQGGGHGGSNGLRDVIRALGGERAFARLRLGVGHPGQGADVAGYLLTRAPAAERQLTERASDEALDVIPTLVAGDWQRACTRLHTATRASGSDGED